MYTYWVYQTYWAGQHHSDVYNFQHFEEVCLECTQLNFKKQPRALMPESKTYPCWSNVITCNAVSLAAGPKRWSLRGRVRSHRSTTASHPRHPPVPQANKMSISHIYYHHGCHGDKPKWLSLTIQLHLELHWDLKGLVGVLQRFKGHVRVAIEPGKLDRHLWKGTAQYTKVRFYPRRKITQLLAFKYTIVQIIACRC